MSRRLQITLYVAFTVFALVASLVLTFPYGALGRRLEVEAAKAMPGTTVVINEIGPALPIGVRLGDVVVSRENQGKPLKVSIDRIRLRPAFLSLLTGKPGLSYSIDAFQGSIRGSAKATKDGANIDAVLSGLQLDAGKTLETATGVGMSGGLSGRVELTMDKQGQVTDGSIAAVVAGGKLKEFKVMSFAIPALDLGSPEVNVVITKGQAKIVKAEIRSSDLELMVTGDINVRPDVMNSLVKGQLHFKPTDALMKKIPTLQTALSLAGQFKKPDGSLEVPLNGTLSRPVSFPMFGRF